MCIAQESRILQIQIKIHNNKMQGNRGLIQMPEQERKSQKLEQQQQYSSNEFDILQLQQSQRNDEQSNKTIEINLQLKYQNNQKCQQLKKEQQHEEQIVVIVDEGDVGDRGQMEMETGIKDVVGGSGEGGFGEDEMMLMPDLVKYVIVSDQESQQQQILQQQYQKQGTKSNIIVINSNQIEVDQISDNKQGQKQLGQQKINSSNNMNTCCVEKQVLKNVQQNRFCQQIQVSGCHQEKRSTSFIEPTQKQGKINYSQDAGHIKQRLQEQGYENIEKQQWKQQEQVETVIKQAKNLKHITANKEQRQKQTVKQDKNRLKLILLILVVIMIPLILVWKSIGAQTQSSNKQASPQSGTSDIGIHLTYSHVLFVLALAVGIVGLVQLQIRIKSNSDVMIAPDTVSNDIKLNINGGAQ